MIEIFLTARDTSKYVQFTTDYGACVVGHVRRNKSVLSLNILPYTTNHIEYVQAIEIRFVSVGSAEQIHFVANDRGAVTDTRLGCRWFQVQCAPVTAMILLKMELVSQNKVDKITFVT